MNYKTINYAIINDIEVPYNFVKDKNFYNYLLNNRIAYHYCKNISKKPNEIEKRILIAGGKRNAVFLRTLKELDQICRVHDIPYLLYKTYKYFDEIIGWDIDIIIKQKDFSRFLEIFRQKWWSAFEDEPWKWKCQKNGCMVIEPHINISWNWNSFFDAKELWVDIKSVVLWWDSYYMTHEKFEVLSIYFKMVYWPEYVDLYDYKVLKLFQKWNYYFDNMIEWYNKKLLRALFWKINSIDKKYKFPYFFCSLFILKWNIIHFIKTKYFNRTMFIHNAYWKCRYRIMWKLPYLTKYINL